MAQMAKVTINWTGFPGGPGFTNLFFRDFSGSGAIDQAIVDDAVSKTDTWLAAWKASLPNSVTTGVDPTVEAIEETTGELQSFYTGTPAAASVGTGGTSYSSPSGAVVSWYTSTVRNGRRMRGRSFMVPLSTTAYETDGTLTTSKLATWTTASTALIGVGTAADLGVWGRPTTQGGTDGQWALVTATKIPDMAAILTSRRN
jgi:hypothetical protein